MEDKTTVRHWLARYKPDFVRCTMRDKSTRDLQRPQVGRGQWLQMERMIEELGATFIEALDKNKNVINVRTLVEPEEDEPKPIELLPVPASGQMNMEAAIATATNAIIRALDSMLPKLAQMFVDVGDATALRHQESYELAFKEMSGLVKMTTDMTSQLAKGYVQMVFQTAQMAQQQQAAGDPNDSAAMNILGGILQGKANGHGSPPPKDPE